MSIKKIKVILVLFLILGIILTPFKKVNAHSIELDPESLISMPMMILGGKGTISIKSSVTNYELYFQAVKVENTTFSQMEKIKADGDTKLKNLKETYTALENELDNLEETYNTASKAYEEGLKNPTLSDEEKATLKSAYETAKTNYKNKKTEYKNKIGEYNNKVNEINSKIKELTPMYVENNWTKTTDNKISIDTTKFSGEQNYVIWAKLVTSEGTYYDEGIYTMSGTKATEIDVTGVSLDKTSLSLTKDSSYTLTATIMPSNATNKNVTWKSDNEDVAIVINGKITAKSVGTATITVITADGNYTKTCKVSVTEKTSNPKDDSKKENVVQKKEEDSTIAKGRLPNTGVNRIMMIGVLGIILIAIIFYKKYSNYRDIK